MIDKVIIKDTSDAPFYYLNNVFQNNTTFNFKKGVNIIIGKNGSGKSSLINLISIYSLCYKNLISDKGELNNPKLFNNYFNFNVQNTLHKGVEVHADYSQPVFNFKLLSSNNDLGLTNGIQAFATMMDGLNSSSGENVIMNLTYFIERITNNNNVSFPSTNLFDEWKCQDTNCKTILLDEPDRNLDLYFISKQLFNFFNTDTDKFQIIATLHNPILIYKLSKLNNINWIETSPNYLNDIIAEIKK